nr:MAG TPA: hypothetical protein [Caudoviricetes sp.]
MIVWSFVASKSLVNVEILPVFLVTLVFVNSKLLFRD